MAITVYEQTIRKLEDGWRVSVKYRDSTNRLLTSVATAATPEEAYAEALKFAEDRDAAQQE